MAGTEGLGGGPAVAAGLERVGVRPSALIWRWHAGAKGQVYEPHRDQNGKRGVTEQDFDGHIPRRDLNGKYCMCILQVEWRDARGRFASGICASMGGLDAVVAAACQPRGQVVTSKQQADALYRRVKAVEEGAWQEELADLDTALNKWVGLRGSGEVSKAEIDLIRREIRENGTPAPRLWRGASVDDKLIKQLQPGRPVEFGPVSTSEEFGSAAPYAESGDATPVVFEIDGAKGLSVADRAERVSGYAEAEWITNGRFYVQSVGTDADGITTVRLKPTLLADDVSQRNGVKAAVKP